MRSSSHRLLPNVCFACRLPCQQLQACFLLRSSVFCFCRCRVKRKAKIIKPGSFDVSCHQREESFELAGRREAVKIVIYSNQWGCLILWYGKGRNTVHSHKHCQGYFKWVVSYSGTNSTPTCLTVPTEKPAAVKHSNKLWTNEDSDLISLRYLLRGYSASPAAAQRLRLDRKLHTEFMTGRETPNCCWNAVSFREQRMFFLFSLFSWDELKVEVTVREKQPNLRVTGGRFITSFT